MLGVSAAAPDPVIAFEIMGLGKDQRTPAGGTAHQPGQPVFQLVGGPGLVRELRLYTVHAVLGRFPCLHVDERFVFAIGHNDVLVEKIPAAPAAGVPPELADIDRVADDILNGAVLKSVPPVGAHAQVIQLFGNLVDPGSGHKAVKNAADVGGFLWQGNELATLCAVAKGGGGLQLAPVGVHRHGAFDLLAQADGIKLVHPLDDALDETAEGPGDERFRDADHVDAALGPEDRLVKNALLLVAGKAAVFPEEDDRKRTGGLLGLGDHPHELRAAVRLFAGDARVDVDVVLEQQQVFPLGVFADLLQLGVGGELRLIVGGDADIGRRIAGQGRGGHTVLLSGSWRITLLFADSCDMLEIGKHCFQRCQYSVGGEALLTGGASCPLIPGEGGCDMTTSEVFQLCLVIIGICGLFLQVYKKK